MCVCFTNVIKTTYIVYAPKISSTHARVRNINNYYSVTLNHNNNNHIEYKVTLQLLCVFFFRDNILLCSYCTDTIPLVLHEIAKNHNTISTILRTNIGYSRPSHAPHERRARKNNNILSLLLLYQRKILESLSHQRRHVK